MKKVLLTTGLAVLLFSCKSEYEERLIQAEAVMLRIEQVQGMIKSGNNSSLERELEELNKEIDFLSKVSGNEEKFFSDLNIR